ncbi:MAG: SDR family oxidoreductase, partial [Bacteroidota bacterium]
RLAESGAKITLASRNEARLTQLKSELPDGPHDYLVLDQSKVSDLEEAADRLKNLAVDILINNTGGPDPGLVHAEPWSKFEQALTQQLRCAHLLSTAALPHMQGQGYGRIVNVISTSVKIPIYGLGVSNTVRGAMASWSKTLSMEVAAQGITVNNILPGFIETGRLKQIVQNRSEQTGRTYDDIAKEMQESVPAKRFGQIEEIGSLAVFLCGAEASYITGTNIPIDGGKTGTF